jgi:hypothetical protein
MRQVTFGLDRWTLPIPLPECKVPVGKRRGLALL